METIVWKEIKITFTNPAAYHHENQFFQKDYFNNLPKISLIMNNKSTDIQVCNESKQRNRILLVYHSKASVVFYIYFLIYYNEKNLNELE